MKDHVSCTWEEWVIENMGEEELENIRKRTKLASFFIRLRNQLGLTQKEVAEKCGVKQPMIARLEKGNVNIGINTLNKILFPLGYEVTITKIKKD